MPMTDWEKEMFSSSPNHRLRQKLSAGDAYTMPIVLNLLFKINKLGEYTITISRYVTVSGDKPIGIWILSAPLEIKVVALPRHQTI